MDAENCNVEGVVAVAAKSISDRTLGASMCAPKNLNTTRMQLFSCLAVRDSASIKIQIDRCAPGEVDAI